MLCHYCLRKISKKDRLAHDRQRKATVQFYRAERCSDEEIAAYLQIDVWRVRCL